jgi:hypothetical protein
MESQGANLPDGPVAPGPLEAEADDWDGDSAIAAGEVASSKASICSSILKYRVENGRTYHGYKVNTLLSGFYTTNNTSRTGSTPFRTTRQKMIVWIFNTMLFSSHSKEGCILLLSRRSKPSIVYLTLGPAPEFGQLTLQMSMKRRKLSVSI